MERFRNELFAILGDLDKQTINTIDNALSCLFKHYTVSERVSNEIAEYEDINGKLTKLYVASLRLEGKSERTINQYVYAIEGMVEAINKVIPDITTNDIRYYLASYQTTNNVSQITLDNKRRYLSAFFAWLTVEEYIVKNPMLRIKRVKCCKKVKKPFTEEQITKIKDSLKTPREKALIEFCLSTGCRVSEISDLNINNVDIDRRECVVLGKGNEERVVYLSEKCVYYLKQYFKTRTDTNIALFVGKRKQRLSKDSIECLMRKIGARNNIEKVHPHRFRRTFATNAINRGMSIQCLQKILGHKSLNTTMIYCNIDTEQVKMEHRKVA